mgnify:CR=1 FL=1|jgi:hypothetical protein|tara:strand:+ start:365 stop:1204 length:840 start_codon:yes stop_codon:yes gene_type:complete
MTKTLIIITIAIFFCPKVWGQVEYGSLEEDREIISPFYQPSLALTINISLEDSKKKWYTISWISPLQDDSSGVLGRPSKELFCYVYDSQGIVGQYHGLSTPMTYCDFQTTDTVVNVFFMIRPIMSYGDPNGIRPVFKGSWCDLSEFKKVRLSVNNTKNKAVILENNLNLVGLSFKPKGSMVPDEMPCIGCCGYDMAICLTRSYLSFENGKILTGKKWTNRKSIKKILTQLSLYQIDPSKMYNDKKGNYYLGIDLIKMKKISLVEFDFEQFKNNSENLPY